MNASAAPDNWSALLEESPECVLIDDASGHRSSLLFVEPFQVIRAALPDGIPSALKALDEARRAGFWVAGYLSYEALDVLHGLGTGMAQPHADSDLLWFGVFARAYVLEAGALDRLVLANPSYELRATAPDADESRNFFDAVERVRAELAQGNCYQINLTIENRFSVAGNLVAIYQQLRALQPAAHAAFVRHGDSARAGRTILSLSPELFFSVTGDQIETRPVKGTSARSADPLIDRELASALHTDEKTRAENLMITDLLRNDLGACAEFGSVRVRSLFALESLPALHQMYSVIEARLGSECRSALFAKLLPALFPCGSVTGAPKLAARNIIRRLEARSRGVYTGAVGYAAPLGQSDRGPDLPGGDLPEAAFNVAIRTLDVRDGTGTFGVGCGLVWDSLPAFEYAEVDLKRAFIRAACSDFGLIETMRVDRGRVFLLLDHVRRLRRGLRAFAFSASELRAALEAIRTGVGVARGAAARLRLLVLRGKPASVAVAPLSEEEPRPVRLVLSDQRIHSGGVFRRHKTTVRELYDSEFARAQATGADDVLFLNEAEDVVETAIANVLLYLDGAWVTPAISSGALPGTRLGAAIRRRSSRWRRRTVQTSGVARRNSAVLVQRTQPIERRKIGLREIGRAKRVLVCNSVRGFRRVGLITDEHGRNIYVDRRI